MLIMSMNQLNTAFQVVQNSCNTEFFRTTVWSISYTHRGTALKQVTNNMREVALVAQNVIREPLDAIINYEHK